MPIFRECDCDEIPGGLYDLERKVGFIFLEIIVYEAHNVCGTICGLAHMGNVKEPSSAGIYETIFFAPALTVLAFAPVLSVLVFAQAVMFRETYPRH